MKLTKGMHTRYSTGYNIWVTEAENRHRYRISIVWREEEGCQVEGVTSFGINVVIVTITEGRKHWYIVGAYVPPNDQLNVHRV